YVSPEYLPQALYDFFKLTLINVRIKNGDAHLKNNGVIYQQLKNYRLGEIPACARRLAPIFDIVSTKPYLPNDVMALSLTGSKRWPKWKVLEKFGKQHCALNTQKITQATEEVEQACNITLPLLEQLAATHQTFAPIATQMINYFRKS